MTIAQRRRHAEGHFGLGDSASLREPLVLCPRKLSCLTRSRGAAEGISPYSALNATPGLTRAARNAGIADASNAISSSTSPTAPKINGSRAG